MVAQRHEGSGMDISHKRYDGTFGRDRNVQYLDCGDGGGYTGVCVCVFYLT